MPSPQPAKQVATASLADAAVTLSQQTLQVLQSAAQFVPVPGIGISATIALSILRIVQVKRTLRCCFGHTPLICFQQSIKVNKEAFMDIGNDACTIVMTVIQRVNLSATGQAPSIDEAVLQQDAMQLLRCADIDIIIT
jgi:hypothetical protein